MLVVGEDGTAANCCWDRRTAPDDAADDGPRAADRFGCSAALIVEEMREIGAAEAACFCCFNDAKTARAAA